MKLNIACGLKKFEGYVNIDREASVNPDRIVDLFGPWPFDENTFDEAICAHILEHCGPEPEKLFHVFREMYRVMQPGAVVHVVVPHPRHDMFLHDPTHVRPVTATTLSLFSKRLLKENADKGIMLTPFAHLVGVDFDLGTATYLIDDQNIKPELVAQIQKDFAFYERHYSNIVLEIHADLTVIK